MRDELLAENNRLLAILISVFRSGGHQPPNGGPPVATAPEPLPPGRWLNTKEATARVGCNRVVLRRWCARYMKLKLPGVRYAPLCEGICYEIHESVVEEWRRRFRGGDDGSPEDEGGDE
jgi:hypothetical protein